MYNTWFHRLSRNPLSESNLADETTILPVQFRVVTHGIQKTIATQSTTDSLPPKCYQLVDGNTIRDITDQPDESYCYSLSGNILGAQYTTLGSTEIELLRHKATPSQDVLTYCLTHDRTRCKTPYHLAPYHLAAHGTEALGNITLEPWPREKPAQDILAETVSSPAQLRRQGPNHRP